MLVRVGDYIFDSSEVRDVWFPNGKGTVYISFKHNGFAEVHGEAAEQLWDAYNTQAQPLSDVLWTTE